MTLVRYNENGNENKINFITSARVVRNYDGGIEFEAVFYKGSKRLVYAFEKFNGTDIVYTQLVKVIQWLAQLKASGGYVQYNALINVLQNHEYAKYGKLTLSAKTYLTPDELNTIILQGNWLYDASLITVDSEELRGKHISEWNATSFVGWVYLNPVAINIKATGRELNDLSNTLHISPSGKGEMSIEHYLDILIIPPQLRKVEKGFGLSYCYYTTIECDPNNLETVEMQKKLAQNKKLYAETLRIVPVHLYNELKRNHIAKPRVFTYIQLLIFINSIPNYKWGGRELGVWFSSPE